MKFGLYAAAAAALAVCSGTASAQPVYLPGPPVVLPGPPVGFPSRAQILVAGGANYGLGGTFHGAYSSGGLYSTGPYLVGPTYMPVRPVVVPYASTYARPVYPAHYSHYPAHYSHHYSSHGRR